MFEGGKSIKQNTNIVIILFFFLNQYTATIPENEKDKLILRIPVEDKDLKYTPNWISKFVITKGNENGNFRIDRDPNTNDGLLYVTKVG